jgi:hypothetical protein
MRPDQLLVIVTARLEAIGMTYCVGGSFASGAYGQARTTYDLDLLIAPQVGQITVLIAAFQTDFDLNPAELIDAIQSAPGYRERPEQRAIAKAYHRATQFRIDFFVSSGRPFEQQQLQRSIRQLIATNPEAEANFASPEDIMLAKLEWFRMGHYASAHQWPDVQAIILVQGDRLDWSYLREWAITLGVRDLLERAADGDQAPTPINNTAAQQRLFD